MSEEFIKNLLGNINYEVETDTNWVEPLGLDRDIWKALLNYIQQKENIIKEVREYIENVETLAMVDKVNIFSISTLKNILYKGEDKQ